MPRAGAPRHRRRPLRKLAALLVIAGTIAAAQTLRAVESPRPIAVSAQPIVSFDMRDPARRQFGDLEFRGGLDLTSNDRVFGGLSGLRVAPDGSTFISVSDRGRWVRGRILYRDGRPSGLADVETAPLLGEDGAPLAERGWYDAEAIAEDHGTLYVGLEKVNEIVRFDYAKDGLRARGVPIALPPGVKTLPRGKGLEAMAAVPAGQPLAGTLIAISEGGLDSAGNIRAFLIGGAQPGTFSVKRIGEFEISDATLMPDGDLLLLERSFSPARGVAMRIRRVPQDRIFPGAVIDGRVLVQADLGYQIDNMEGLAVHKNAAGETVLTLVSDDNFSPIQRTLLLQFVLIPE